MLFKIFCSPQSFLHFFFTLMSVVHASYRASLYNGVEIQNEQKDAAVN